MNLILYDVIGSLPTTQYVSEQFAVFDLENVEKTHKISVSARNQSKSLRKIINHLQIGIKSYARRFHENARDLV